MKYKLKIEVEGETVGDLVLALEQVLNKVEEGYIEGADSNDTGRYRFEREVEQL